MTAVTLAAKLSSSNESTWMRLGALSELMHDTEKALYCYENAIRHSPYNIKALTQAASICRMREQYPKAVEYFLRILNVEDTNGEIWGAVGHCYLMMDDLQNAYTAYQKALYHLPNPKDPNLWYGIGILYDRYGSFDHAEEAFTAVLKMDNKFEKANEIYFRLGIIYKQQMKHEQSLDCFRYILQKPPRPLVQADIWFQIGHVHELQKDFQLAKDAYERVLKENPSHAKVLQQLGWLYHHNPSFGNQDTAISYLMRSIDSDPSDGQTWYLLGRCYMAQQKFRKAYDAYQQAVYRDGRNPTFWCSIGVLYYQINQYRDALDAYSRAIRLNPYLSEVWYDLGTLYESCNNQISDALDAYQRAAELDPHNKHIQQRLSMLRAQLPGAGGKANSKEFEDDAADKSVPRTIEPRHGPSDGMLRGGRRPPPNALDFPGEDKPNMPNTKLPDIVDITGDRQNSLPSATELDSSLNESKTASRSAQDTHDEIKRLRNPTENKHDDLPHLPHKLEMSNGNGPNFNGHHFNGPHSSGPNNNGPNNGPHNTGPNNGPNSNGPSSVKEEKERGGERDKDAIMKEKEKERDVKDSQKEKEKEKEKEKDNKKEEIDYDKESPPGADQPPKKDNGEIERPPRPTEKETVPEKETNGRANVEETEKEEGTSKRGLEEISQSASKRTKRSPSHDKSPSSPSPSSTPSSSLPASSSTPSSTSPASPSASSTPSTKDKEKEKEKEKANEKITEKVPEKEKEKEKEKDTSPANGGTRKDGDEVMEEKALR